MLSREQLEAVLDCHKRAMCEGCPAFKIGSVCGFICAQTALTLMDELEATKAERDAAVGYIEKSCYTCKYWITDGVCEIGSKDNCYWQWRGAKEDKHGAHIKNLD